MENRERTVEKGKKKDRKKKHIIKEEPGCPQHGPPGHGWLHLAPRQLIPCQGSQAWAGHPGPVRTHLTCMHTYSAACCQLFLFSCPCCPHLWWHCGLLAPSPTHGQPLRERARRFNICFGVGPFREGRESKASPSHVQRR